MSTDLAPLPEPSPDDPLWTASDPEVAVHNVEACVGLLAEALVDDHLGPLGWPEAALLLKRLRAARADLHRLEGALETHITNAWRSQGLRTAQPVDGVGMVEANPRPTPQRRDWRHDSLTRDLIDAHMRERGGEAPDPFEVRDWILEAAGIGYWRVTPLRDLGLVPDDYCIREPGPPTVRIT